VTDSDALIADASLIGVGWSIWSRSVVDANGEPVGGVVCGYERMIAVDDDGEITDRTVYRVRTPFGNPGAALKWRLIDGDDINVPDGIEPVNRRRCNLLARRISKAIGTRAPGPMDTHELTALRDAIALQMACSS
jgi:hypothetical protein